MPTRLQLVGTGGGNKVIEVFYQGQFGIGKRAALGNHLTKGGNGGVAAEAAHTDRVGGVGQKTGDGSGSGRGRSGVNGPCGIANKLILDAPFCLAAARNPVQGDAVGTGNSRHIGSHTADIGTRSHENHIGTVVGGVEANGRGRIIVGAIVIIVQRGAGQATSAQPTGVAAVRTRVVVNSDNDIAGHVGTQPNGVEGNLVHAGLQVINTRVQPLSGIHHNNSTREGVQTGSIDIDVDVGTAGSDGVSQQFDSKDRVVHFG